MNRFLKGALLAAAFTVAMVPAVFADGPPYATFNIKLGQNPAANADLSPTLAEPITKDHVAFHIMNNTGKELFFNSNNNEGQYIPLVSNNTVTVPYHAGDEYKVVDADGNVVATWNLNGNGSNAAVASSASQEQYAAWGNTLQQVIENQKVAYQEPPAKAEPRYYEGRPAHHTSSKTVIRGYW